MKIFAFYLPQFHEIPENNEWWGKGFTEWTNVKKAEPLFYNHLQPMHPLNDNYYDLSDYRAVEWQTKLMHDYGVDGLIYYHYYFDGKKLLEKPAENLLKHSNTDQKFFFCWANHSWKKTWNGTSELLVEQTYGNEKSWEEHFQYLLPFFKDSRYEKKDNKPLFMIFQPFFDEKDDMMSYFDKRCKEEGFNGIAVIDSVQDVNKKDYKDYRKAKHPCVEYIFFREPGVGQNLFCRKRKLSVLVIKLRHFLATRFKFGRYVTTYKGDRILREALNYKSHCQNALNGIFFEWDNTVRHGDRGYIITPISKETFREYMEKNNGSDYIFVNAWNEWCEGMMLEPTKEHGYKYLQWIKEWK